MVLSDEPASTEGQTLLWGSLLSLFSKERPYFVPDGALALVIVFVSSPKKELLAERRRPTFSQKEKTKAACLFF